MVPGKIAPEKNGPPKIRPGNKSNIVIGKPKKYLWRKGKKQKKSFFEVFFEWKEEEKKKREVNEIVLGNFGSETRALWKTE